MPRIARILLAAVLLTVPAVVRAADDKPLSGNWKVSLATQQGEQPLWLIQLQEKDGKWTGKVVDTAEGIIPIRIEQASVGKETLRVKALKRDSVVTLELRLPPDKEGRLRGSLQDEKRIDPVEMERSTAASLKSYDLNKELLSKQAHGVAVISAGLNLLSQAAREKAKPEEVRSWAAKVAQAAQDYGGAWHREVLLRICELLSAQKGFESIALPYARQADRMTTPKDRLSVRLRTLELLAKVLEQSNKADEAKAVKDRLAKIDFAIKPITFAGRRGKSTRVVLVELFTSAQAPSCAGMELALDALTKTFKPNEVIALQYHLNVGNQADPLSCPAALSRIEDYTLRQLPTAMFDGRTPIAAATGREEAVERYETFVETVKKMLESPAQARIELTPRREGDKITVKVGVSNVSADGDSFRVCIALVEDVVQYAGQGKLDQHHHVVRAFLGGDKGLEVAKGKEFSKTVSVDLSELRKKLKKHLDEVAQVIAFPDKERPLELSKLRVVAFVQNGETGEILQAAQADVPAGKGTKNEEGK